MLDENQVFTIEVRPLVLHDVHIAMSVQWRFSSTFCSIAAMMITGEQV